MRKSPVVAAAALAGLGWVYSNGQFPKAQGFGRSFIGTPGRGRLLALTYDDGPNTTATPALLDVLGSHDARATFFTIGRYAEEQSELLREVAARGHAIGNHTYSHLTMPFHTAATVREELRTTTEAIERSGVEMARVQGRRLMRPPYGRRRPGTLRLLRADGYVPIMWSVTLWDWRRGVTADWIVKKAEGRIRGGDVILLHDGSDLFMGSDRSQTVEATERILARWKADGYEFVTIPEMVERTGFVYP